MAVVLTQGAAQHYVACRGGVPDPNGVTDLDVWTFYAAIRGEPFPAERRETHADFGPSELGRQLYDLSAAKRPSQLARWKNWNRFKDDGWTSSCANCRSTPMPASTRSQMRCGRGCARAGASNQSAAPPSSWYLARKAVVLIEPVERRGGVVWRPQRRCITISETCAPPIDQLEPRAVELQPSPPTRIPGCLDPLAAVTVMTALGFRRAGEGGHTAARSPPTRANSHSPTVTAVMLGVVARSTG